MDKQYYIEYYKYEREHWFFLARNFILMQHLKKQIGKSNSIKILNIGIATGKTSELLSEFGEVKSVEFDEACFNFTKEKVPQLDLIQGSILELPFEDNQFDLVCAFDVIEHVKDDELAVSEMKRVCKKKGMVFVSVPAYKFLWSDHDVINMHERRYTRSMLVKLFKEDGKIIFRSYFNFWLFLPILLYRKVVSPFVSNDSEQVAKDFNVTGNSNLVHKILLKLFKSESSIMNRGVSFPFGVSLLLSWRNQ